SVPMWLTAIALAWVLGKEAGVDALALGLVVTLALAIVLWVAGQRQRAGLGFGVVMTLLLLGVAIVGAWSVSGRHPDRAANT
ncbi:thiol:disulfide interchange protein, partial [Pseudomonas sp. FW305-130]